MKPIDFITAVEQYNAPIGAEMEARLTKPLIIISEGQVEWEILSYYYTPEGMCLDIQPKK